MKSLWPTFDIKFESLLPKEVLKIQASKLEEETHGLIIGEISSSDHGPFDDNTHVKKGISEDSFVHTFYVKARLLRYSFTLLKVAHGTNKVYPCFIKSETDQFEEIVNTEEELVSALSEIFNTEEVVTRISSLYVQSNREKD